MKKAVAVLLVLIMSFSLFACSGGDDDKSSSSTDNVNKTVSTTKKNNPQGTSLPDETTSGASEEVTIKEPKPMPKGEKVKKPTNKYGLPVDANYLENLRKIFASNKYTFDMNMNVRFEGQTFYVPTVICRNGKKIAMDFEIGISSFLKGLDESASSVASAFFSLAGVKNMKIKYISTGTKNYLVMTSLKKYVELSDEESVDYVGGILGDTSISSDADYVGTSKIKVGGINYVCEEFKSHDGEKRRYYFCDGELKRIELDAGANTSIIEVNSIKGTVNNSAFSIPSDCKPMSTQDK